MKIRLKLFLNKTFGNGIYRFTNIENCENFSNTYKYTTDMIFTITSLLKQLDISYLVEEIPVTATLTETAILNISDGGYYVIFDCDYESIKNQLVGLVNRGVVEIISAENHVVGYCYDLVDATNVVKKTLNIKFFIFMTFKDEVNVLTPIFLFNLFTYPEFNYIYIPELHRYYYVDSITIVRTDLYRISCRVDVLTSYKEDILEQNAFITRTSDSTYTSDKLIDNRLPVENMLSVEYVTPTPTSQQSTCVNCSFNFNASFTDLHFICTTISAIQHDGSVYPTYPPDDSGLPTIDATRSRFTNIYYFGLDEVESLLNACKSNDVYAGFISSCIYMPFNVADFDQASNNARVWVNDRMLSTIGTFIPDESVYTALKTGKNYNSVLPYFVVSDFTLTITDSWINREPNAYYELYVVFVGWVKLNIDQVANKRLLVYYAMDYNTGLATANIYNYTDKILIWSQSCQLGYKVDILTTNAYENSIERIQLESNAVINSVASAVGILGSKNKGGAGLNAVVGIGKQIAQSVQAENLQYETASMTLGNGLQALYSQITTLLRVTRHNTITIDTSVYNKLNGSPANQYMDLDDITSGSYVEVGEIKYTPVAQTYITLKEINEIESLLKDGVIL